MSYKIPRSDLCMSDAMPFSQHWEARIPVTIEAMGDAGEALTAAYSSLRPGDSVSICAFTKNDWARLAEIATFRIVKRDHTRIYAMQIGSTLKVSEDKVNAKIDDTIELEVVKVGSAYEVRDKRTTATLDVFVSKEQAEAYVAREEAKNKPAAGKGKQKA